MLQRDASAPATGSARRCSRRRRWSSPGSRWRSGSAPGCSTSACEGQLYRWRRSPRRWPGVACHGLPAPLAAAALAGGRAMRAARVGRDPGRAQGALRRPRGDQHDHAQLHRLRARRPTSAARVLRARDGAHRRDRRRPRRCPRLERCCRRCAARPPTCRSRSALARGARGGPCCCSAPGSATSCARSASTRRAARVRRRVGGRDADAWRWRSRARWPGSAASNFVLGYKHFFELGFSARRRLHRDRGGAASGATIRSA